MGEGQIGEGLMGEKLIAGYGASDIIKNVSLNIPRGRTGVLDEPTTYLDIAHQIEILDLLADINAKKTTTIVMVLHDIHLAARYADHLIALRYRRIVPIGRPGTISACG